MFKGYKLEKIGFTGLETYYYQKGLILFDEYNNYVRSSLDSFFEEDQSLNGSKIINSWFPDIKVDVFISHSHKDEKLVIALAGWLYEKFGLFSFIDSCIWGYGNELIQILDNKYSWLNKLENIYNYNKVLVSTGHVHMMLSTALASMIDKTECLIFFDTPNSISPFETADKTESPWIYSEIAFSEIVRRTLPPRLQEVLLESTHLYSEGVEYFQKAVGDIKIKYDLNTRHLKEIDYSILNKWENENKQKGEKALDKLYEITFPNNKKIIK